MGRVAAWRGPVKRQVWASMFVQFEDTCAIFGGWDGLSGSTYPESGARSSLGFPAASISAPNVTEMTRLFWSQENHLTGEFTWCVPGKGTNSMVKTCQDSSSFFHLLHYPPAATRPTKLTRTRRRQNYRATRQGILKPA